MLLLGCGTSWFVAQCLAELREAAGLGETDAVCASEYVPRRRYDRVVAITRSGTSTEVLDALRRCRRGTAPGRGHRGPRRAGRRARRRPAAARLRRRAQRRADPLPDHGAGHWPGPRSATTVEPRWSADGRRALDAPLPADPADIDHLVFLGTGWTVGLAHEAALKVREAAQAWSESYPAMDFRHGPVAVAGPRSLVWSFGALPADLDDVARDAGAAAYRDGLDPLAQLVLAQRFALALAAHRGLDPDRPRLLTRSVVLPPTLTRR